MAVASAAPSAEKSTEDKPASKQPQVGDVLHANLGIIERAVASKETRLLFGRVLRTTASVRGQFTATSLKSFMSKTLSETSTIRDFVLKHLEGGDTDMEDADAAGDRDRDASVQSRPSQPEEELYCMFLLCQFLCDQKEWSKSTAVEWSMHSQLLEARALLTASQKSLQGVADAAVEHANTLNRRTLDVLAARTAFYLSLSHERLGTLANLRPRLLSLHATAVLNHDDVGQEVLLNLLLRNYLHYNLYDQAEKLRAQAQRPEAPRSNQQYCRYLYFLGRIRAVQLEYSEAKECLQQAARKTPSVAKGFLISVHKWLTVIRLLLGEIPTRAEFDLPGMRGHLQPYLSLTAAVRSGDVTAFNAVAAEHEQVFQADATHNLINRLRYNVLRAGLRRISVAYSRISLQDVAAKLGLKSVADTEAVVAKAIRDGSVSAALDHEKQWLVSRELGDAYVTDEPQRALHARTAFCMDIHNEAVKAMRFDAAADTSAPTTQEKQAGIEEAIAAAMADDADDF